MLQLIIIVVRLIFVGFVIQAAVLVTAQVAYRQEDHDLLASYADVMPGQVLETFTPNWCGTYDEYDQSSRVRLCRTSLNDEPFFSLRLYIRDHTIQRLTFRAKGLYLGDLARMWGQPTIQSDWGRTYAWWDIGDYLVIVPIGSRDRFNYWLLVDFLEVEFQQLTLSGEQP